MTDPAQPVKQEVNTKDALACFIFDLIRDYVPLGKVEAIIGDLEDLDGFVHVFQDPHLGNYCISLAQRIRTLNEGTDG